MTSPRDIVRKLATPGERDPLRFARALIGDLVDKNLWPVALLLCVAIVAIPVLMTRGGGSDGAAGVPAVAPPPDVNATKAVELIGPPTTRPRPSKQLDPFRHPKKKKAAAAAGGSIAVGPGASPAAAPSAAAPPSTGAPSTGAPSTGAPSSGTPTVNPARVYYRTEVRWSQSDGASARPL